MTMKRHVVNLLAVALLVLGLAGCGAKTVIFAGESEPADFSLSFQEPQEFKYMIQEEGKEFGWAIELTYFPEQMQGWENVPVYYIHIAPDGKESDGKFTLPIKDSKGEWIGAVQENGHDRRTEVTFKEGLKLAKGQHVMKFYGDNAKQGQPILGIVRFTFKVFG